MNHLKPTRKIIQVPVKPYALSFRTPCYQTVSLGTSVCGGRRMFPNKVKDNIQQTLTYRDSESLTTRLFGGVANRRL